MGSTSQEILRSFCSNTNWKYAVFWKLNHQSQIVLTLEDAYYDNHGTNSSPEVKGCSIILQNMHGRQQTHDLLSLAVANMTCHVYSLGEGIVGQVAVSGEHQWVFPEYYHNYHSAFEFHNIWESQMSAGIKTILVVAVGPCGVVQLGSLRKIDEDVTLVNHIRNLFLALKDPLADDAASLSQCSMTNMMCLPKIPSKCLHVKAFPDCSGEVDSNIPTQYKTRRSDIMPYNTSSSCLLMENRAPHVWMTSGNKDPSGLDRNILLHSKNHVFNNTSSSDLAVEAERLITEKECSYQNEVFQLSENPKETDRMLDRKCESSRFDGLISSGYTFAGSELLEALGSAFKQTSTGQEDLVKSEHCSTIRPPDDMSHSQLTFDSGPDNLLDAVVANVCHSNARDDILPSRSAQSFLTSMEIAESSGQKKHIISVINQLPSTEVYTQQNPSDICGAFSSIGFSSTCLSSSSDQFQTPLEMPKKTKKRAKPGESSRPRPRDRQLIQDRIKELRELVPNGSKCSIDSLLERTIKHMLFLQNVTKHAEKLSKSGNTKMQQNETGTHGSSCAVEVGGHLQIYSIIVENLNKQGVVLIEMLCEECSHFLEIANMIRSLDLIILRGNTEIQGEKTWICFVVESQNNKVMQRMDILWSLLQIFQPKSNGKP